MSGLGELAEQYWDDAVVGHLADGPRELARCRNSNGEQWESARLVGFVWNQSSPFRVVLDAQTGGATTTRKFCQIYAAPHPGTGYRAIDPWVDSLESGDEIFDPASGFWGRVVDGLLSLGFSKDRFYRRKVKPPVKLVPFDWENREKLFGYRIVFTYSDGSQRDFVANDLRMGRDGRLSVNGVQALELLERAKFFGTNNPVGMRVEP